MSGMTRRDCDDLAKLARKRAKVATANIAERTKVLRAEVEDQLADEYKFADELWADLTREAQRVVAEADQRIAAKCEALGMPEELRPSLRDRRRCRRCDAQTNSQMSEARGTASQRSTFQSL